MAKTEKSSENGDNGRVSISLDPEVALRALLRVDMRPINAEDLAVKYHIQGLALRNMLRAHPELLPGHKWHEHYRIDAETEDRIVNHPEFSRLPRR